HRALDQRRISFDQAPGDQHQRPRPLLGPMLLRAERRCHDRGGADLSGARPPAALRADDLSRRARLVLRPAGAGGGDMTGAASTPAGVLPLLRLAAGVAALLSSFPAQAQTSPSWPTRAIRLVVPTGPGAATDVMARLLAEGVTRGLGQPVVVENLAGASGLV